MQGNFLFSGKFLVTVYNKNIIDLNLSDKVFQNFLLKKMLRTQGVPEAQIDMFITMMEKNPELFKKIAEEIKAKMDQGADQKTASMEIMKKYEEDLRKLAQ